MNNNFKDINQKMELILTVGQILAENGATTDRIIRNSQRVAAFMQIPEENFHLQVMPSILFLHVYDGEKTHFSFRSCEKHGVDMNIIATISQFSWHALKKKYSAEKFQEILNGIIERKKIYTQLLTYLAPGIACGAFCILFGGDFLAAIYTAICAAIGKFLQIKLLKFGINSFVTITFAALVSTVAAYFAHFLPTQTIWVPLLACSLFLIPGVPIINSAIDTLNGFLVNGLVQTFRTILISLGMTVGIVIALVVCTGFDPFNFMELCLTLANLNLAPQYNLFIWTLAAAVAAIGFSILFNMPIRCLLTIGLLGTLAVFTRNILMIEFNLSQEIGSFVGATLASFATFKVAKWVYAPMQVLIIPALIPLVPGVLIYGFLFSCLNIAILTPEQFFLSLQSGIDTMQIIFLIAIGAALPNLLAKKIFDQKNKDEQKKFLNEVYTLK